MNELFFLLHVTLLLTFLGAAVRLGSTALSVYVVLGWICANLFVAKQILLFSLHVTCSDAFAIASLIGLNLLQEFHGKTAAKEAIRCSFGALILFACLGVVHLLYVPSYADTTHEAFVKILSFTPRLVVSSIVVSYLVQQVDLRLFTMLRKAVPSLGARLIGSALMSQALDTVLFSFIGLYGLVDSLWNIIFMSFAIKCITILCIAPAASFYRRFRRELSEAV